jgi:hypothetical protein
MSNVVAKVIKLAEHGEKLDTTAFLALRDEFFTEHKEAATESERELLIASYLLLLDQVERTAITPDQLTVFRTTRTRDYRAMLLQESFVGTAISPERLSVVAAREVAAGRLQPDDPLCNPEAPTDQTTTPAASSKQSIIRRALARLIGRWV